MAKRKKMTWNDILESLPLSNVGELIEALSQYPKEMEVRIAVRREDGNILFDRHVYVDKLSPKESFWQRAFNREIVSINTGIPKEELERISE